MAPHEKELNETQAKLEKLRAEAKALADARKAREQASADAKEIARLEQLIKDNKAIEQAEREYGPQGTHIACFNTPRGVVIVKRAALPAYRMFQDVPAPKVSDFEELVNGCRAYPDVETWDDIHDEFPGLLMLLATAIGKLAGASAEEASKK